MLQRSPSYYDDLFARLRVEGVTVPVAVERAATAYLDGKPRLAGKKKLTKKERDSLFLASDVVKECPSDSWHGEAMVLALARYFGQEAVAVDGLAIRLAHEAPDALIRAIRYSGLVLNPGSPRRSEVEQAATASEAVAELCRILDLFGVAHRERVADLDAQKAALAELSVFDLLIYASLYAFEVLVPRDFQTMEPSTPSGSTLQRAWDAINDLLAWKLAGANSASLQLTDASIGRSVAKHLRPILFEAGNASSSEAHGNLRSFHALMAAQVELNEFTERSAEAFCYDDGIRFERYGARLEIVEVDPSERIAWQNDGRKLERLHGYWFHRAIDTYVEQVASDPAKWSIGQPENAEANRVAWLRALQSRLRLREAYGVDEQVTTESGNTVDTFQALLSLNLMSAFFLRDFLAAFADRLKASRNWVVALQRLTLDGLREGLQNRLPLTWSDRDSKVTNITGWTATPSEPKGNPRAASAIIDFWAYDMVALAGRLQRNEPGLHPHLFERPVLKFGATLIQLPWVVGLQNNSTAAINNLIRLGARRGQARDEAGRVEACLARLFEARGFKTLLNWQPPHDVEGAGEVDLIAVLGDLLLVIEVKSTFLRRSQREAWLHATTTLRKAGHQLQRKIEAVARAIAWDSELHALLNLTGPHVPIHRHGLIVDTSIECDHRRFSGFLKVSVEELLIALRDDRHLLNDPIGLFDLTYRPGKMDDIDTIPAGWTLYPTGFSPERFVEVIETGAVWELKADDVAPIASPVVLEERLEEGIENESGNCVGFAAPSDRGP